MRKLLAVRRRGRIKLKSRSVVQVQFRSRIGKQVIKEYPVRDLDAILLIGSNIYIESSAVSVLSSMNIPVAVVAKDSIGILMNPVVVVSSHRRSLQYRAKRVDGLEIALEYIKAKIWGLQNVLKYRGVPPPSVPSPPAKVEDPEIYESEIRIWESTASHRLWQSLITLIDPDRLEALQSIYGFSGRKPRHPDPFNKALSVMYAVLYSLATKALIAAGLDPTYGFLHRTRYSTPLTFDYTEMFKPIAVDATITLINTQGLPQLGNDGELTREWVNKAIKHLYDHLTLRHKDTGKTPYQQIFLKAFCLARHLEGRCRRDRITITWNRRQYRRKRQAHH